MQSLKDLTSKVSEKKQPFFFSQMRKSANYFPRICVKVKKKKEKKYVHDLVDVIYNHAKFQLDWIRI